MPYPNPLEIAEITSGGIKFSNWETVWIQERWGDSALLFRFTCSEFSPMPVAWTALKFLPGDFVDITLGGQKEVTNGLITDRQVAYDANSHSVELSGRSYSWHPYRSSVDTPDMNFDGLTFEQVARKVLARYGVAPVVKGQLNPRVFEYLQAQIGESNWDFLESIARPRGIVLGSDHEGNVLLIGDHPDAPIADLVEGVNILKCQCVFSIQNTFWVYTMRNSTQASNDIHMSAASEQEATANGTGPTGSNILTPAEHPTRHPDELKEMVNNEAKWSQGTVIKATITLQGWMRPGTTELWHAGNTVRVYSPMAVLDMALAAQNVTFTQDRNSGTLTTLELVVPWLLNKKLPYVDPFAPQPPTAITTPQTTPQQTAPQTTPQPKG
jgi:prophage tail gpP-like protein